MSSSLLLTITYDFLKQHPFYIFTNLYFMAFIPLNDIYIPKLYGTLFESIHKDTFSMQKIIMILIVTAVVQLNTALMDINDARQIPLFQHTCKSFFLRRIFEYQKEQPKDLTNGDHMLSQIMRAQHIFTAWYSKLVTFVLPHIVEFAVTLLYFFYIDNRIGIAFSVLLLCCAWVMVYVPTQNSEMTVELDKSATQIHAEVNDIIGNYLSIHKENKIEYELTRLEGINNTYIHHYDKSVKTSSMYRIAITVALIAFIFYFTHRAYTLLVQKRMDKSQFFALIMMIGHLISNILWLNDASRDAMFDYGTLENSYFLRPLENNMKPAMSTCKPMESYSRVPVLQVKDLFFKYNTSNNWTLKNVNMSVHQGETALIIGEIGSGKSTLSKIILQLMKQDQGGVYLNSVCYDRIPLEEFYKHVGFMPQNCVLFNRSIIDNIQYDNEHVSEKVIVETLHAFGIMKHFSKLKQGLHTFAGVNGSSLSGGQRQLVWILKLYFKNSQLIIMDEPTASIDPKTKEIFIDIFNKILKDKTVIIITHDSALDVLADKTFEMRHSEIHLK